VTPRVVEGMDVFGRHPPRVRGVGQSYARDRQIAQCQSPILALSGDHVSFCGESLVVRNVNRRIVGLRVRMGELVVAWQRFFS
jgi:hypothetical protein